MFQISKRLFFGCLESSYPNFSNRSTLTPTCVDSIASLPPPLSLNICLNMVQRLDIAVPIERRPCVDRRPDEMYHHHQQQQQRQQQHQLSHSRENSLNEYYYNEVYKMNTSEPLYATVIRKRPLPPVGLLEVRYGGREVAHRAAIVIQRAFR